MRLRLRTVHHRRLRNRMGPGQDRAATGLYDRIRDRQPARIPHNGNHPARIPPGARRPNGGHSGGYGVGSRPPLREQLVRDRRATWFRAPFPPLRRLSEISNLLHVSFPEAHSRLNFSDWNTSVSMKNALSRSWRSTCVWPSSFSIYRKFTKSSRCFLRICSSGRIPWVFARSSINCLVSPSNSSNKTSRS